MTATVTAYGEVLTVCNNLTARTNFLSAVHVRVKPDASPFVKGAAAALVEALRECNCGIEAYAEADPLNIQDAANIAVMIGAKL